MWFAYAILGATFKSLGHLNRKQLAHTSSLVFTFLSTTLAALLILPFVIWLQLPVTNLLFEHFWLAVALAFTSSTGLFFNMKALSREQLSFVAPLNGFIPVFGLIAGWQFLANVPPAVGFLGISIIFVGSYIIGFDSKIKSWYEPLKRIFTSRAGQFAIANGIFYALNTVVIKVVLDLDYDAFTIFFVTSSLTAIALLPTMLHTRNRAAISVVREEPKLILFATVNSLLGSVFHYFAVAGTYIGYALAVRRFDAIISVVLGWKVLNESNIRFKLIGASLITLGAVILALSTS